MVKKIKDNLDDNKSSYKHEKIFIMLANFFFNEYQKNILDYLL